MCSPIKKLKKMSQQRCLSVLESLSRFLSLLGARDVLAMDAQDAAVASFMTHFESNGIANSTRQSQHRSP